MTLPTAASFWRAPPRRSPPASAARPAPGPVRRQRAALHSVDAPALSRSDRRHELRHPQPWLSRLRHVVRHRRELPDPAADGQRLADRTRRPALDLPSPRRPQLPRRLAGRGQGLHRLHRTVGEARCLRPDPGGLRGGVRPGGCADLHDRVEKAVPPCCRRLWASCPPTCPSSCRSASRFRTPPSRSPTPRAPDPGASRRGNGSRARTRSTPATRAYRPREEAPSWAAGGKVAKVDRIEWLAITEASAAVGAMIQGAVRLVRTAADRPDPRPQGQAGHRDPQRPARADPADAVQPHAAAVQQPRDPPGRDDGHEAGRLHAGGGRQPGLLPEAKTFFTPGSPMSTGAGGAAAMQEDLGKAKAMLAKAGYKGEKVVLLARPTSRSPTTSRW